MVDLPRPKLPGEVRENEDNDPEFIKSLGRTGWFGTAPSDVYRALLDFGKVYRPLYADPEPAVTRDMNKLLGGALDIPMVVGGPLSVRAAKPGMPKPPKGWAREMTKEEIEENVFSPGLKNMMKGHSAESWLDKSGNLNKGLYNPTVAKSLDSELKMIQLGEKIKKDNPYKIKSSVPLDHPMWDVKYNPKPNKWDYPPEKELPDHIGKQVDEDLANGTWTPEPDENTTKLTTVASRFFFPTHTQYGIPPNEIIPGKTYFHGTHDEGMDSIPVKGFKKGSSAELSIGGTSVSKDPIVSLKGFSTSPGNTLVVENPGVPVGNMSPFDYFAKKPDNIDMNQAYNKPNTIFKEHETFFPHNETMWDVSTNQKIPPKENPQGKLQAQDKRDNLNYVDWFTDLKDHSAWVNKELDQSMNLLTSSVVTGPSGPREGYMRLVNGVKGMLASKAYGRGAYQQMLDKLENYFGEGSRLEVLLKKGSLTKELGPQRTAVLKEAYEAAQLWKNDTAFNRLQQEAVDNAQYFKSGGIPDLTYASQYEIDKYENAKRNFNAVYRENIDRRNKFVAALEKLAVVGGTGTLASQFFESEDVAP